jgi:hypothetical protein
VESDRKEARAIYWSLGLMDESPVNTKLSKIATFSAGCGLSRFDSRIVSPVSLHVPPEKKRTKDLYFITNFMCKAMNKTDSSCKAWERTADHIDLRTSARSLLLSSSL